MMTDLSVSPIGMLARYEAAASAVTMFDPADDSFDALAFRHECDDARAILMEWAPDINAMSRNLGTIMSSFVLHRTTDEAAAAAIMLDLRKDT